MNREPNAQMIALMDEAGFSNKGLAKRMRDRAEQRGIELGTTHVGVQRWRDGWGIRPSTAAIMAEVISAKLGRTIRPSDLGFFDASVPAPAPVPVAHPETMRDVLTMLDGLSGERLDPPTDDHLVITDSDLNAAILKWMVARPDGIHEDRPATQRVGVRDVLAIRTAAEMFTRLDFQFGGGHGQKALRHYFRHEALPLLSASYSEKVGRALFTATAEIAEILGWAAYDIGNHHLGYRYLLSALRLAQVPDDRMLGAAILANMSHQANYLGHYSRATDLARAAIEGGRGQSTPRAMALFAAHEARAQASVGDPGGAGRAMNEAERHFEKADTADDPKWLAYVDEAEIIGEFSHCFRDLKRPAESLRFAEKAVAQTDPRYARTLGFCRIVLAESQLLNGDLEDAITTARLAVDEGGSLQSARFSRYVTDFQRKLSQYAGVAIVTQFNEHVIEVRVSLEG